MKVLVFTTLFPNHLQPNAAVFIKQRMFHFARLSENEIRVVAPVPYCPAWVRSKRWEVFSRVVKFEKMEGIPVYHPRYPLIPRISMLFHGLSLFAASLGLVKRIRKEFDFNLIDAHYIYPDGFAAVLLGKVFGKPVVLSARGSDINQFSGFRTIRPMLRFALEKAEAVISVCAALKQEMIELGCNPQRIEVIPNGVDVDRFRFMERVAARAALGIPPTVKVILSVGSLIPRKGFDLLIDAMPQILKTEPGAMLFIIGGGEMKSALEQQIQGLGLEGKVMLMGEKPNDDLYLWYNSADAFCLASSREGWANVIMEALACGCPVVATNVYGAPEIITSPDVGRLVERKPEALARGLLDVLSREWDRERIRAHVSSRDWMTVAREVEATFKKILAGKET